MDVYLEKDRKTVKVLHDGSAASLLSLLGVNPDVVLIVKDGVLITSDVDVSDAKRIELLSVISGG